MFIWHWLADINIISQCLLDYSI